MFFVKGILWRLKEYSFEPRWEVEPTASSEAKINNMCGSCYMPLHEISNNVVCATSKGFDQPAHMCSLIRAFASRLHIL